MSGELDGLYMKAPCGNCPFRKDCLSGCLGASRAKEITESESFVCHKQNDKQCSGSMQLLGKRNIFVRTAHAMGLEIELRGRSRIFDSNEEMIDHHTNKKIH